MDPVLIASLGLLSMFALIVLHVPIGVAMAVAGVVGVGLLIGFQPAISLFSVEAASAISNEHLAIIAIFLLMGAFASVAGLSADIFKLAYALVGHRPGGLAAATVIGCGGFGAVCGSSVATTATMARIALPEMRRRNYSPELASGSIASGGTLGVLIPPSVILVLYGVLTEQFVVALFAAAVIPGLLAIGLYLIAIEIVVRWRPESGPAGPRLSWHERSQLLLGSWRVLLVAIAVSGGIYSGVFTVTEAASVGATLCLAMAILGGHMNRQRFFACLMESAANTGMIFVILIGASIFSYFISLSGAPDAVVAAIRAADLPTLVVLGLLLLLYVVLGSVFDAVAAMVITLPFVYPLIIDLGYSPIWWGVVMVMVIEIGMITPPIGLNVFVLQGAAKNLSLRQVYSGITPFLFADVTRLALVALLPGLALTIPDWLGFL